jgi:hypothetical protein
MGVTFVDLVLVRKVEFSRLLCDARFKRAFDGVAAQVLGAGIGGGCEEDLRLSESTVCQLLKIGSVHLLRK